MAMYQIECAYTCHTGNIRANNEDNFWCFGESLPVNNEGTKGICSKIISGNRAPAMAVFDGMGGESCGESMQIWNRASYLEHGKHNGDAPLYTRVYVCLQSWGQQDLFYGWR